MTPFSKLRAMNTRKKSAESDTGSSPKSFCRRRVSAAKGESMMNAEQLRMARHALGLPNKRRRSYRNRYVAGLGTTHERDWDDLVSQGMAERGNNGIAVVGFCLTEKGALAALEAGEKLDAEDFPPSSLATV